jgi:HSP20 family protein
MRRRLRSIPPSVRGDEVVRRGLSFRTVKGPKPQRKPWVFATKPKFARIEQFREPLLDVFDEADEINIILDVAGFKEEEIHWEIERDVLKISAKTLGREWEETITLPEEVDEGNIQTKYQNAILEIKLNKKKESKKDAD